MVIIKMMGGLGNQMFQYALGRKLMEQGRTVKFDISYYDEIPSGDTVRKYELDGFGITIQAAELNEIKKFSGNSQIFMGIVGKIMNKNFSKKIIEHGGFVDGVLECDDRYLIGYWQTEKYFRNIRQILVKEYDFGKININKQNEELKQEILSNNNSVSVHVRGGDYFSTQNIDDLGNVCTAKYYEDAFSYFENIIQNPIFYLFTNDLKWVKENLDFEKHNVKVIDWNTEQDAMNDMYMMSLCKYNIIANSSFSWWAAWLNQNEEKIVVAPRKWNNTRDDNNVVPDEWVKL